MNRELLLSTRKSLYATAPTERRSYTNTRSGKKYRVCRPQGMVGTAKSHTTRGGCERLGLVRFLRTSVFAPAFRFQSLVLPAASTCHTAPHEVRAPKPDFNFPNSVATSPSRR